MSEFVPNNLGFNHVTRHEIIHQHTSTIAQQLMCADEPDTAIVVIDGTYIYIQVRRNISFFELNMRYLPIRNLETTNFKRNHSVFTKNGHY
jgi:hypothetical protein